MITTTGRTSTRRTWPRIPCRFVLWLPWILRRFQSHLLAPRYSIQIKNWRTSSLARRSRRSHRHNTPLPLSDEPTLIDSALEHATTPSSSPVPTITVRPKCHFSENGLVYPSNLAPESRGLLAIKSNTAAAKVAALIPFRQEMTCRQWCF
jgi:hypothetical protein